MCVSLIPVLPSTSPTPHLPSLRFLFLSLEDAVGTYVPLVTPPGTAVRIMVLKHNCSYVIPLSEAFSIFPCRYVTLPAAIGMLDSVYVCGLPSKLLTLKPGVQGAPGREPTWITDASVKLCGVLGVQGCVPPHTLFLPPPTHLLCSPCLEQLTINEKESHEHIHVKEHLCDKQ